MRYPVLKPCAENSFGPDSAAVHLRITIRLINCSVSARSSTGSDRSFGRKAGLLDGDLFEPFSQDLSSGPCQIHPILIVRVAATSSNVHRYPSL
jgi:hypothetical protein